MKRLPSRFFVKLAGKNRPNCQIDITGDDIPPVNGGVNEPLAFLVDRYSGDPTFFPDGRPRFRPVCSGGELASMSDLGPRRRHGRMLGDVLEFVSHQAPIEPVFDHLNRLRIARNWFQLLQRDRQLAVIPPHENEHFALGSHFKYVNLLANLEW